MFSLLFQFVGAVLLSWNQIIKRRYDLALEGKTLINNSQHLSKEKSIKILKNYYYNLLGFIFIALGYLFQIFEYEPLNLKELNTCCIILVIFIALLAIITGIHILARLRSQKLIEYSKKMDNNGIAEMWIGEGATAEPVEGCGCRNCKTEITNDSSNL